MRAFIDTIEAVAFAAVPVIDAVTWGNDFLRMNVLKCLRVRDGIPF